MSAKKGSSFERQICKQLSRWWSDGKRDDIFWRSSQSGGRATQRAKFGKSTFGSHGDIAAVDPVGRPLLDIFTIELKRGRSHGSPIDLYDAAPTPVVRPFEAALNQAREAAKAAGSKTWMLICRRDRKVAMVFVPRWVVWDLEDTLGGSPFSRPPAVRFDLRINQDKGDPHRLQFVGMPLDHYLARITPKQLLQAIPC